MKLAQSTLASLRRELSAGRITPREIIADLQKRVEQLDGELHAYRTIDFEDAFRQAESADLSQPLGGIPIAIKDNINVRGQTTACSSRILEKFQSPYDATVIRKLRDAGAVFLGRTNMDEFAMGSSCEHSAFGPTVNPWKSSRGEQLVPGGSSGGSAAAVAADLAVAALGSDTGGSIRQPAAFCGCVGVKPTYGRVSRYGLVAFASSLDQIGPLAKSVEDAALLMNVISGHDPMENTSRPVDVPDLAAACERADINGLTIGKPKEYYVDGLDPDVASSIDEAISWFESHGAKIKEISLPHTSSATAVYYILATAEASANLARFDGVRYGQRSDNAHDMIEVYRRSREEGFGPEVKRRILLGTYALSSGYYDAYYHRAQKVRHLIRTDFENAFKECDLILTPTAPFPAFPVGDKIDDPLMMYLNDIYTIAANLSGVPAISLPCRPSPGGLPIGLQLIGPHFGEEAIFSAAAAFEQDHDYRTLKPELGL
jgi:aspartyl-tRNA(Asn)/glutamyl-tRNA(Gln) amidotransferase subunit A